MPSQLNRNHSDKSREARFSGQVHVNFMVISVDRISSKSFLAAGSKRLGDNWLGVCGVPGVGLRGMWCYQGSAQRPRVTAAFPANNSVKSIS